jgi:hypothetical protein
MMSDQYVDAAKDRMNIFERLLKGLPGIHGYVDKELRRDADKRLRETIAGQLEESKQALLSVQRRLLEGGGLMWLDNVDSAVQKLQILIDRIKTASYGYAGLFDPVRIRQEELDALYRFDVALAERAVDVRMAVDALGAAADGGGDVGAATRALSDLLTELNTLYNKRHEAVLNPGLLDDPNYAPAVESVPAAQPAPEPEPSNQQPTDDKPDEKPDEKPGPYSLIPDN